MEAPSPEGKRSAISPGQFRYLGKGMGGKTSKGPFCMMESATPRCPEVKQVNTVDPKNKEAQVCHL